MTDEHRLLVLNASEESVSQDVIDVAVSKGDFDESRRHRLTATIAACMECHSFERGDNTNAPHLADVYGRGVAATDFEGYSASVSDMPSTWDEERLRQFLADPEDLAPWTIMPDPGLSDESISDLVLVLEILSRPE